MTIPLEPADSQEPADRPWRTADALVYVGSLEVPELSGDDAHHLRRVLRLRPGAEVCLGDGRGGVRAARLGEGSELVLTGPALRLPAPSVTVTIGVAPPKGDRLDLLVAKACELGVDRIVLFEAQRSVVRWDAGRAAGALERLARVVRAAGAQSRRPRLPDLEVGDLSELIDRGAPLADLEGRAPAAEDRILLVGPEGGWTEDERRAADARGGRVRLAAGVLRTETAAIAAATVLGLARLRGG